MRPVFLTVMIFLCLAPAASRAQMALPGAVDAPTPVGQAGAPPPVAARATPRRASGGSEAAVVVDRHFAPAKPPAVETVIGKPLGLAGSRGALTVEKSGADLRLSRLTLTGDKISQPNQACEVAMGGDEQLKLNPLGAPDGVLRYALDSSACPLQFDFLNGALRATSPSGACSFAQADCRVDGAGLWGPPGTTFGEAEAKTIERDRATAEKNVRAHFRSLLARLKKDKPAIQAAVREQAAFSSQRAQTCRDYDRDDAQGFCALRLTEARDFRLQTRLAATNDSASDKKAGKKAGTKISKAAKTAPASAPAQH
jgi:hypothetical protein